MSATKPTTAAANSAAKTKATAKKATARKPNATTTNARKAATGKVRAAKATAAKPVRAMKESAKKKLAGRNATAKVKGKGIGRGGVVTIPPQVDDELAKLWHGFKGSRSPDARERLILHYAPLVKYVASRVAVGLPASVEQSDLVSYGMFGLIDALEKFEPGRGTKFETYAIPRIKGAIIDELRAMDWVPRSVRFKAREIDKAHQDLESMLKRQPSEHEMAERLGMSRRELHDVVTQISFVSVLALDEMVSVGADRGEQVSLLDTLADKNLDPTSGVEGQETRGLLAAAINSLSEREKIVVTLYYFEGLTLAEIGEILGVTESRVCQIHTKAVGGLRGQLSEFD
ncbi:MAG TPA: RNA polymerase sigma factor WhiG [Actinomycetota bacterium]|nr:RNA polymerase sigma factor WhiG [Actinomycetota bacterium]